MTRELFYLSRDRILMTRELFYLSRDQILMTREVFYLSRDRILMTQEPFYLLRDQILIIRCVLYVMHELTNLSDYPRPFSGHKEAPSGFAYFCPRNRNGVSVSLRK